MLLLGAALTLASAGLFARRGTAIKPFEQSSTLVVEGPYRLTRNPMYLGMILVLSGLALLLGSTTPFLLLPPFVWLITSRFVIAEERMLADRFGAAYEDYQQRVRRWL